MSGRSARNHMTDAQLIEDAAYWREKETDLRLRSRTEWNPSGMLGEANACRERAEASERFLRQRRLGAEQVARSGVET
jgi:hypothetical protein